jgi:hypothetical protein
MAGEGEDGGMMERPEVTAEWEAGKLGMTTETANGRGTKLRNEYVNALGRDYAETPKAVYAALAFALAMRLSEDNPEAARALLAEEWLTLHVCGVIPQKPK